MFFWIVALAPWHWCIICCCHNNLVGFYAKQSQNSVSIESIGRWQKIQNSSLGHFILFGLSSNVRMRSSKFFDLSVLRCWCGGAFVQVSYHALCIVQNSKFIKLLYVCLSRKFTVSRKIFQSKFWLKNCFYGYWHYWISVFLGIR